MWSERHVDLRKPVGTFECAVTETFCPVPPASCPHVHPFSLCCTQAALEVLLMWVHLRGNRVGVAVFLGNGKILEDL